MEVRRCSSIAPASLFAIACMLDLYDSYDKQLVWRAVAQDSLSDKPETNEKKLEKAVNKMMQHFLPQGRG